jgi:hypothetical protein
MARRKRDPQTYIDSAAELSPYVPKLKRFSRRKKLKPWEKSYIARIENIIRRSYTNIDDLHPVSKSQAKKLKGYLYEPEIMVQSGPQRGQHRSYKIFQAMQFRNVGDDFRIDRVLDDKLIVRSNGRTWIYWKLPRISKQRMIEAAEEVFEDTAPDDFNLERLAELAGEAFDNPKAKLVYLWSVQGRVGFPMRSLKQFIQWISESYLQGQSGAKLKEIWVNGLAILVADVDEYISRSEINSFTMSYEERRERARERQQLFRKRKKRK